MNDQSNDKEQRKYQGGVLYLQPEGLFDSLGGMVMSKEEILDGLLVRPSPAAHVDGQWCENLRCSKCYSADTWKNAAPQSPLATPITRDQIEKLLREYRCQHTQEEEGNGMLLIDVFTPIDHVDITAGKEEVHLLADMLAAELATALSHTAPEVGMTQERYEYFLACEAECNLRKKPRTEADYRSIADSAPKVLSTPAPTDESNSGGKA